MIKQKTIKDEISFEGIGLHSGAKGNVRILPAPSGYGIVFKRIDISESPEIKADYKSVIYGDLFRRATIGSPNIKINTIEHFMAVCRAFEIDNLRVYIDCEEFPFFDGSAREIAERFSLVGTIEQSENKNYFAPKKPFAYKSGDIEISVIPSDRLIITMWVEYKNKYVGAQNFSSEITQENFIEQIAPARTFGFVEEIEFLRKSNLIKGGSLDNALVFGDDGLVNQTQLRFPDEVVRHKVLDFIGDLSLIGNCFKGHYIAVKSGHKSHIEFVNKLIEFENKGD